MEAVHEKAKTVDGVTAPVECLELTKKPTPPTFMRIFTIMSSCCISSTAK